MIKYIGEEVTKENENTQMVIYKAVFPNGKMYIGQSRRKFRERKNNHKGQLNKGDDYAFYRAIRKYGWDNLKWELIETCDTFEELNFRESYWIEKLKTFTGFKDCNGYNSTLGGDQPEKLTNFTIEDLEEFGKDYFNKMGREELFQKYNKRNNMNRHQFYSIYNGKIWSCFTGIPRRDFSIEPQNSIFTPFQVDDIIEKFKKCGNTVEIAKEYNCKVLFITQIITGKNWSNYTGIKDRSFYEKYVRRSDKLSNEDILKIVELRKQGLTYQKIKEEYYPFISISLIGNICTGTKYSEITGIKKENIDKFSQVKTKITPELIDKMIELANLGVSVLEISRQLNIKDGIVQKTLTGQCWSEYTGITKETKLTKSNKKLDEKDILEIIRIKKETKKSNKKIGEMFGVSNATISDIINGKTHNNITHIKDNK